MDYGGFKGAIALISLVLRIFHDSGEGGPCPHSKALATVYISVGLEDFYR